MKAVIEALAYACFIFIIPLCMVPQGYKFLFNWLKVLVWLQAWPPMYAILNFIMNVAARSATLDSIQGPQPILTMMTENLNTLAHTGLATIVGLMSLIAYGLYRETYLDTAIADKVPRSMGGGVVVSRIIDREFTNKIDQLSKNLKKKK